MSERSPCDEMRRVRDCVRVCVTRNDLSVPVRSVLVTRISFSAAWLDEDDGASGSGGRRWEASVETERNSDMKEEEEEDCAGDPL